MRFEGFAYAAAVLGVVVGTAMLLSAEYFHGVEYLLLPGGGLAIVAVFAITALIGRHDPPEDAGH